jgi:hypothetical protein
MQVSTNPVVAGTCTADPLTGLVITAKNLFNANPDPASQLTLRVFPTIIDRSPASQMQRILMLN